MPTPTSGFDVDPSPEDREVDDVITNAAAYNNNNNNNSDNDRRSPDGAKSSPEIPTLMTTNYRQRLAPKAVSQQLKENVSVYDETDR